MKRDFIARTGTAMTIAAWLIFLAILFGLFDYLVSHRDNPNQNIVTTIDGQSRQITLQRNRYGHYVANGSINGFDVIFLLDTGATEVAIPENIAERIGLQRGHSFTVKTANGNTRAYRTRLESVAIGDIHRYDMNATILTNMPGKEVLLGMNFLKHFEIIQKGKSLTIKQ